MNAQPKARSTAATALAVPPPAASATALPALDAEALIAKAIEHQVPVEALERLLAMRAELKREQARAAFFAALSQFQSAIPAIPKRQTATVRSERGTYSYHYADIADIQRAIAPALQAHGLAVTFDTAAQDGAYLITCRVHHTAGHSEASAFRVPVDTKARMNGAQQAGSALTYGRRYALCAALGIVTAEDDDDAQAVSAPQCAPQCAPEPVPAPVQAPVQASAGAEPQPPSPTPAGDGPGKSARGPAASGATPAPETISAKQHRALEARIQELGLDRERVRHWVAQATANSRWGQVAHLNAMDPQTYEWLLRQLPRLAEEQQRQYNGALAVAKEWGWSGELDALPDLVQRLRAGAEQIRREAAYADRGYADEMSQASRLMMAAGGLERYHAEHEARAERSAIQAG